MSATPLVYKYPYDPTGVNSQNLVSEEKHTIPREDNRAFATLAGPFFTDSLVVKDASGNILKRKTDYVAFEYVSDPSEITGKEVCCAVLIKNSEIEGDVFVTYQAVGGPFSLNVEAITQAIANLEIDARTVAWGDILAKPDYFPPLRHLHDIGDIYGFEYIVNAIEDLRNAVLNGDTASHSAIIRRIDDLRNWVNQRLVDNIAILEEHIRDASNPHAVNKNQVGLGQVQNFPIATEPQALAGTANDLYMTPYLVAKLVSFKASDALLTHAADKSNPHGVTKEQVGLGLVQNYGMATLVQAAEGTSQILNVSPAGVTKRIETMVLPTLNQHITNQSNPHAVNKNQVGLGNVDNYKTATPAEALLTTTADKFLTPALVYHILANYSKFTDIADEFTRVWAELAKLQATYSGGKQTSTVWVTNTAWGTQAGTSVSTSRSTTVLVPAGPSRVSTWTSTWTSTWNSVRNTSQSTTFGSAWTTNWTQQTTRQTNTSITTNWYYNTGRNTTVQEMVNTVWTKTTGTSYNTTISTGVYTAKWDGSSSVGHYTQVWTAWSTNGLTGRSWGTQVSNLTAVNKTYLTTWSMAASRTTTWTTNTAWATAMSQQTSMAGSKTTTWATNVAQSRQTSRATSVAVPGGVEHNSTRQTTFDTAWNTGRTTSQQTQYQRQTTTGW